MAIALHKRPAAFPIAVSAIALLAASAAVAKNWSGWGVPASIESLPGSSTQLNTAAVDGCPSLSPDGLSLFLTSSRPGGSGGLDIWVAQRSSTEDGWENPVNLGAPINSAADEFCATMTHGNRLYFSSRRTDAQGDLYVVRLGPKGWGQPTRLGPNINSSGIEESPSLYEDEEGRDVLYFSSNRSGVNHIYYSVDFGPAQLAPGSVNSSAADMRPTVSHNGLEIFWDSTRFGTLGAGDFWTARRTSTSDPWDTAVHLVALSGPGFDARPFIAWDGSTLVFASIRAGGEGNIDTYITNRGKITGGH